MTIPAPKVLHPERTRRPYVTDVGQLNSIKDMTMDLLMALDTGKATEQQRMALKFFIATIEGGK
ncbi:MAG: hypothetical protein WC593_15645 [Methanoregula sp.]